MYFGAKYLKDMSSSCATCSCSHIERSGHPTWFCIEYHYTNAHCFTQSTSAKKLHMQSSIVDGLSNWRVRNHSHYDWSILHERKGDQSDCKEITRSSHGRAVASMRQRRQLPPLI